MQDLDYHLLSRHLAGETTCEDDAKVDAWKNSSPKAAETYFELKLLWELDYDLGQFKPGFETAWKKVERSSLRAKSNPIRYVLAAVVAVIITMAFILWNSQGPAKAELVEKRTIPGQKTKIQLADGSIVHLNSFSGLIYPSNFDDSVRKVQLQGEGFFEVIPDSKPFIVNTGELEITVLGTSFNVNGTTNDIQVAVASGLVKVKAGLQELEVEPGQLVSFEPARKLLQKTALPQINQVIGWKDGWLIFDETPLVKVIGKLENWFGISIKLEGEALKNCLFTGKFHNETLNNIMDNICFTSNLKYKTADQQIILYGTGCPK